MFFFLQQCNLSSMRSEAYILSFRRSDSWRSPVPVWYARCAVLLVYSQPCGDSAFDRFCLAAKFHGLNRRCIHLRNNQEQNQLIEAVRFFQEIVVKNSNPPLTALQSLLYQNQHTASTPMNVIHCNRRGNVYSIIAKSQKNRDLNFSR